MNEDNTKLNRNSLSIKDIIGGVLTSIIDGQNQSLDNVMEFLERLLPNEEDYEHQEHAKHQEHDKYQEHGKHKEHDKKKYITIVYDRAKFDDPGTTEKVTMHVPLISLLPIPYLSIKEVELDFDFKIHSVHKEYRSINHNTATHTNKERMLCNRYLRGSISPSSRLQKSNKTSLAAEISIKMVMREENLGAGINALTQEGEIAIQKMTENKDITE